MKIQVLIFIIVILYCSQLLSCSQTPSNNNSNSDTAIMESITNIVSENDFQTTEPTIETTQQNQIIIPNIINVTASSAEKILINMGLIPIVEEIEHDDIKSGNVVECYPAIGEQVEPNTRVIVYISNGNVYNKIQMLLSEQQYKQATEILETTTAPWKQTVQNQIILEEQLYEIIDMLKSSLGNPEIFQIQDILVYQFNEFIDIDGDGTYNENIEDYPLCLIKYSIDTNNSSVVGFFYDSDSLKPYQYYPRSWNMYNDEWNRCQTYYSSYEEHNYNIDHLKALFESPKPTTHTPNVSSLQCYVDGCMENAIVRTDFFDIEEYYCLNHYNEIIDIIIQMENDFINNDFLHQCQECNNNGTHEIIGILGNIEYYCTYHYQELIKYIENLT